MIQFVKGNRRRGRCSAPKGEKLTCEQYRPPKIKKRGGTENVKKITVGVKIVKSGKTI